MDEIKFRKWTGLTQQQYDIIKVIYRLRNRGVTPTPKNIQREYRTDQNKYLMKPNLFNILRILQEKKVIKKIAQAEYALDQEGITTILGNAKTQLTADMDDLDKTHGEVDQFFKDITYRKEQPDIRYLEGEELYRTMAESLETSEVFNIVSDFPTIAYNREMLHTIGRETYAEKLWQALKNKKPAIQYLTDLNIDNIFNHAFRTYGDPKTAYRECINAAERLQTQTENHKSLEVRHTDTPHGLDVAIIQQKEPVEFIMFARDDHDDIQGGVKIRSHRTASNALRTFRRTYDYATDLNTPQGKTILQKTKQAIKQKYGILGE